MRPSGSDFQTNRLFQTALSYAELGFSVIPILGDAAPHAPKISAVDWKPYQSRRASHQQLACWFDHDQHAALAIVTGRISNLIVLDFDDPELADEFALRFPELTQTRTVESAARHLPHYYFSLPPSGAVDSIRARGVDLLSDGRYVIAPPSTFQDVPYTVVRGGLPRPISNAEIRAISQFIRQCGAVTVQTAEKGQNAPISGNPPVESSPVQPRLTTTAQVADLYRLLASQIGRNNALFKTAVRARDDGFSQQVTAYTLVDLHASQPAPVSHTPQSYASRQREAHRTIASAFSRPPRKPEITRQRFGLPNAVREAFLQAGQTAVARVLDALLMAGFRSGDLVSERMIRESLKGQVGRHSILKSLSATLPDASPVFAPLNPSPAPPTPADAASKTLAASNKKCFLLGATKPDKTPTGRPTTYYAIPHFKYLCHKLDVENKGGDELQPDDILSVRKYRQGMERELFKRSPGMYSRDWLANRLGVSLRTCQRYHRDEHITITPMYHARTINWSTIDHVPDELPPMGTFLLDGAGKRYPALRPIARRLLARGQSVQYFHQLWNDYRVFVSEIDHGIPSKSRKKAENSLVYAENLSTAVKPLKTAENRPQMSVGGSASASTADISSPLPPPVLQDPQPPEPYRLKPQRFYRQPLPDIASETAAQNLAAALNRLSNQSKHKLSQANARKWVHCYGKNLIHEGLGVVHNRRSIENPVGFLMVWLRSTARERSMPWISHDRPPRKRGRCKPSHSDSAQLEPV